MLEIKYEDLISYPVEQIKMLLNFIDEPSEQFPFNKISGIGSAKTVVRKRKLKDDYSKYLTPEQIDEIVATTEPYFGLYGYRN